MYIGRTSHYQHHFLIERGKLYQPSPLLIVGSSGTGKTMLEEYIVEEIEDNIKKTVSIFVVDAGDELESAFSILPATDKEQLEQLKFQREEPEPKNTKIWCVYSKKGLNEWINKTKKRFGDNKLPKMEFFTIGIKSLGKEEVEFLLETEEDKKSVRLFLKSKDSLKNNDDINEFKHLLKKFSKKEKKKIYGKLIETEEEPVADVSDLRDVLGSINIFEEDDFLMPQNFFLNFDIKKILNEPNCRHIIVCKTLKDDKKLRHFIPYFVLNEIERNISDCEYLVNLVIEEAQTLAPIRGRGHFDVLSKKMGDLIGRIRKRGKGVTVIFVGRSWDRISDSVKNECKKQIMFHLEQRDMQNFVKVRNLSKKVKDTIENLKIGEYVLRGYEWKKIGCKVPRHGHKHHYQNFEEEYRKFYLDKLTDYTELINNVENQRKEWNNSFKLKIKKQEEDKIIEVKKEAEKKAKKEKTTDELKEIKVKEKENKILDKQQRDEMIVRVYNEFNERKQKISLRKISDEVNKRGFKCSYVLVDLVLKKKNILS